MKQTVFKVGLLMAGCLWGGVALAQTTSGIAASGAGSSVRPTPDIPISVNYLLSPVSITAAGGTRMTMTATGTPNALAAFSSITINGKAATNVTLVNAETLTFVSPANPLGTYQLYVNGADFGFGVGYVEVPYIYLAGSGSAGTLAYDGTVTSSATSGGGKGAATDTNGYVWSLHSDGASVDQFDANGNFWNNFTDGLTGATALAIDGKSNVWVANGNGTIQQVTNGGSAGMTVTGSTTAAPAGVAIDLSGDIWVTNPSKNTLDEVIGGAAPVAPLSTALINATTGARP